MTSKTTNAFSPEVPLRAVRRVPDHEGEHPSRLAAIMSISGAIGCTAQTLNGCVRKAEVDSGCKPGLTTDVAAKLKMRERENRELLQAVRSCARRPRILPRPLSANACFRLSGKRISLP